MKHQVVLAEQKLLVSKYTCQGINKIRQEDYIENDWKLNSHYNIGMNKGWRRKQKASFLIVHSLVTCKMIFCTIWLSEGYNLQYLLLLVHNYLMAVSTSEVSYHQTVDFILPVRIYCAYIQNDLIVGMHFTHRIGSLRSVIGHSV